MAETVLIAQASSNSAADAVQNGVVVTDTGAGEVHAGTETAGETHTVFPPFDPSNFASQLLWFALTFAALYFLMSRLALPQIGSIIDKRKARIDGDLKEAERLRGQTDQAIAAYEAALAEARKNAHAIAEETRNAIKSDLDGKRKVVEDDLSKKVAEAETRISKTKQDALGRVGEIATETAAAVVTQLVGEANTKDVADAVSEVVKG